MYAGLFITEIPKVMRQNKWSIEYKVIALAEIKDIHTYSEKIITLETAYMPYSMINTEHKLENGTCRTVFLRNVPKVMTCNNWFTNTCSHKPLHKFKTLAKSLLLETA